MAEDCTAVIDVGSSSVKAGFVGDDVPCAIFPSVNSDYPRGTECVEAVTAELIGADFISGSSNPVNRGVVTDWDQMERLWSRIMESIGIASPDNASIFLTEPPKATVADRMKWGELLFETFRVPSVCIGNSASLCLFAAGRTTGTVVECGAGVTSAVPVFEGLPLTHAVITMEFGGQDITASLRRILAEKGVSIDSFDARMIKEKMAFVDGATAASAASKRSGTPTHFELPDGTEVTVDARILTDCTEPLLRNDRAFPHGLINQVSECLKLCDDAVRKDLANNIIIAGGTSMLPGETVCDVVVVLTMHDDDDDDDRVR